jgi:ribosomal protein S18 acetylase RimI-like enzyme
VLRRQVARDITGQSIVGRGVAVRRLDPLVLKAVRGDTARGVGRGAIFHRHNPSRAGLDMTVTDAELMLRRMTRAEFTEWLPHNIAGYAEHIAASGALPEAAAREKAERDTARLFSAGFDTPGQYLFRVLAGDVAVGWLWLGVPGPDPDPLMAWVYQIEIAAEHRGRGYGRTAMLLAEDEARARGMASLGLNVHGQNTIARSLYTALGYQPMSLQLKKAL